MHVSTQGLVWAIDALRDALYYILTPRHPVLLPAHHTPLFPKCSKGKRRMPYTVRMLVISIYLAYVKSNERGAYQPGQRGLIETARLVRTVQLGLMLNIFFQQLLRRGASASVLLQHVRGHHAVRTPCAPGLLGSRGYCQQHQIHSVWRPQVDTCAVPRVLSIQRRREGHCDR